MSKGKKQAKRDLYLQSIIFDKSFWTKLTSKAWLRRNQFKHGKVDVTKNFFRYRQLDPKLFKKGSFITKYISSTVALVEGELKK